MINNHQIKYKLYIYYLLKERGVCSNEILHRCLRSVQKTNITYIFYKIYNIYKSKYKNNGEVREKLRKALRKHATENKPIRCDK